MKMYERNYCPPTEVANAYYQNSQVESWDSFVIFPSPFEILFRWFHEIGLLIPHITVYQMILNICNYCSFNIVFLISWCGLRPSPLGTASITGLLHQPQMKDDGDCGAIGGMKIGRGNRSIRRKPAAMTLCPPQIPHDLTWDRIRAAAVRNRRLTAWARAKPIITVYLRTVKIHFMYEFWGSHGGVYGEYCLIGRDSVLSVPYSFRIYIVAWRSVFRLVNVFIDHLYTQLGTKSNYSSTANLHDSQITTASVTSFPAYCVFIRRFLVTASNSGRSSASSAQILSSEPPVGNCLTTDFVPSLKHLSADHVETSRFEK
jgi:hypothetical protein